MKNKLIRIAGIVLSLAVVAFLFFNKNGLFVKQNDRSGFVSGRSQSVLQVKGIIIKPEPIKDLVVASGTVYADEQVEIAAETSGRIIAIHFNEGSNVKAGELLVTINNADLLAQITRNKFQLQLAKDREHRQRNLLDKQGISQQTYDQIATDLNAIKADSALLQAQLEKTMIKAPFSGVLGLRYLSQGSYVSPGTKIVRLSKNQPVKIEFSVPEKYSAHLRKGSIIQFKVENQPNTFEAKIYASEPVIEQRSRSIVARALNDNLQNLIIPGSFARVELSVEGLLEALQVNAEALIPEMGSHKVFVYRNGNAQPIAVETGIRTSSKVQIKSGLNVGDTVLVTGILQLRPGIPVQLTQIN